MSDDELNAEIRSALADPDHKSDTPQQFQRLVNGTLWTGPRVRETGQFFKRHTITDAQGIEVGWVDEPYDGEWTPVAEGGK